MRGLLIAVLAGCGRLGFDIESITTGDAGADAGDPPDAIASGWTHIAAGDQTTCGIYQGRAYCWGRGTQYEIGDGGGVDRALPAAVVLPPGTVTALAQGEGHGCAIVEGAAYCWGGAPPGNGTPSSQMPVAVIGLPSPVTSIGCGNDFSCAVAAGDVYCWGADQAGSLGNGAGTATIDLPAQVTLPGPVVSIDAGNDHALVLLADGNVWGWGHNDSGALGTGVMTPTQYDTPVQTLLTGVQPRLAGWHACAVIGGAATCWGLGTMGELGDGLMTSSATPRQVSGMDSGVETLMTGGGPTDFDATCAVIAGATSCWGNGRYGRLGTGATDNVATPTPVQGVPADTVELALGYGHSCARSASGVVRCWGRGDLGQLGDGGMADSFAPLIVPLPTM